MEIRQLEYFVSASLLGNLTRVAERHFVSQPNITIAIKKLETELGVTLFDRKKNKLVLTEEGMFFLQKIEPILIALKNSVAEMKDYRNENGGIVTLGIPPMISLFLFHRSSSISGRFIQRWNSLLLKRGLLVYMINFLLESWILLLLLLMTVQKN